MAIQQFNLFVFTGTLPVSDRERSLNLRLYSLYLMLCEHL